MAKNSLKSMIFKTEEEEQIERLNSKLTVDKGIQMFLEAKAKDRKSEGQETLAPQFQQAALGSAERCRLREWGHVTWRT